MEERDNATSIFQGEGIHPVACESFGPPSTVIEAHLTSMHSVIPELYFLYYCIILYDYIIYDLPIITAVFGVRRASEIPG